MNLRVKSKVWIENEVGMTVIGEGRFKILKAIRETGSISKAAVKLGQPFRRIWARVKDAEQQAGFKLVETNPAGSRLTPEGEDLLRKYGQLSKSCNRQANSKFQKVFGIDE
ncbi:MAG: molybdate transport system regulatory protein [Thermodesulfobacteriota bacterium]|nr:molybdate transport system regulatory protein [Thermodesulfobacteriota bacterium]